MFPVGFDHPEWHNGFEHDPEESARVRIALLRELAENRGLLVAAHLPFPSVGRVASQWRGVSLGAGDVGLLTAAQAGGDILWFGRAFHPPYGNPAP